MADYPSKRFNAPWKYSADRDLRALVRDLERASQLSAGTSGQSLIAPYSIHDDLGTLLYACPNALAMLGLEEFASTDAFLDLVHVQDKVLIGHFLKAHDQLSSSGTGASFAEFRPVSSNTIKKRLPGAADWIELTKKRMSTSGGRREYTVVAYRDISRRKAQESELVALRDAAEMASVSKSRFLANISHELRTPLNAILGFSELLKSPLQEALPAEKRTEYIGLIHDSATHLYSFLNDILNMSKIETGKYEIFPENFNLADCVRNTVSIMQGQAQPSEIRLECTGLEELPEVIADKRAVRQILINLISNAIKFSDRAGLVRVMAERRARTVRLLIRDDGIGMSPENLQSLGKPFFQADSKYDRKYEGTGLGLSVVKGLVDLHGGSLEFKSERNVGTTAIVILPIYGRSGRSVPSTEQIERVEAQSQKTAEGSPNRATHLRIVGN